VSVKRIRPDYSPFPKKLPNNSAHFSLDRMRLAALSFVALFVAACASDDEATRHEIEKRYVVKYYDRNHDGVVDLELHDIPGAADAAWVLVDTKFTGRYDLRVQWSVAVTQERVDIPVPRNVHITPGQPPVRSSDLHIERSNQSMKPTTSDRMIACLFATAPCRGLSLSR
jgi:hypothetical protein